MKNITLEQLAEKLNGKFWTKGELKRVYIERGYNTKKMSTKTYVHEVNGNFKVNVYIDCQSQGYNWIKSQQEQIIESVENEIYRIEVKAELVEKLKDKQPTEQKAICFETASLLFNGDLKEEVLEMAEYYDELVNSL